MVKASEVVYKYYEVEFAVKHKKDGFKAGFVGVLIGYYLCRLFFVCEIRLNNRIFLPIFERFGFYKMRMKVQIKYFSKTCHKRLTGKYALCILPISIYNRVFLINEQSTQTYVSVDKCG